MFHKGIFDKYHPIPALRKAEGKLKVFSPQKGLIEMFFAQERPFEAAVSRIQEINVLLFSHSRVALIQFHLNPTGDPVRLLGMDPAHRSLNRWLDERAA
jgi:hypothetical protein